MIKQSIEPPRPGFRLVFSAFSVGLFANAVLPGRVGELARVAVLRRRIPGRRGATATLVGSVFAHRMFDLFPAVTLVVWVLVSAKIPGWALTSIAVVLAVGVASLRRCGRARAPRRTASARGARPAAARCSCAHGSGSRSCARRLRPRQRPRSSSAGWTCQLFAVWAAMRAFHIYQPLAAAGLVLVLINVATIFPLWPGNFGARADRGRDSRSSTTACSTRKGVAFGVGLQAIEASVGVGVGLIFLAREGLSYAVLKQMDDDERVDEASRGSG